jgi:glycogen debranching enzyme
VRRGRVTTDWNDASATLRTVYENGSFHREIVMQAALSDSRCRYANGRLTFDVEIERGRHWHTCLLYTLVDGTRRYDPPKGCLAHPDDSRPGQQLSDWRNEVLKLSTSNEEFYRFFAQSVEDLASLRLPLEGTDHLRFVPAAGIPWFVALFGRDTLITAMQTSLLYPVFARGVLETLGELQATERDDDRDAEPGKILHELRFGELAVLKKIPHTPYYGSADATPLYITTLHLAWRSTADRGFA